MFLFQEPIEMDILLHPDFWTVLLTLTALEIILGVDNLIFITITIKQLPVHLRNKTRLFGLGLALVARIFLLFIMIFFTKFNTPLIHLAQYAFSGKDIIFIAGGLFLSIKSIIELYHDFKSKSQTPSTQPLAAQWFLAILQIALIDIVFSLDSVITAIGITSSILIMIIAIMISILIILFFSKKLEHIIEKYPLLKTSALIVLIFVGIGLVKEGLHF